VSHFDPPLCESHFALRLDPPAGAIVAVPVATTVPGATITLRYEAHNASATPSPPARVRFMLPPGVVAESDQECALGELAPGEERECVLRASLPERVTNGTVLCFQAALLVPGAPALGSNIVRLTVRGRPRLAGPDTLVWIAPSERADAARVCVRLGNSGDGAAEGLRVHVPPPAGTRPAQGAVLPVFTHARLEPAECVEFDYDVVFVEPTGRSLVASDAWVELDDGSFHAIAASAPYELHGILADPRIETIVNDRHVRIVVHLSNDGFAALEDVRLDNAWPRELRIPEGSLMLDGAPLGRNGARNMLATVTRSPLAAKVTIARIAARTTVTFSFDGYVVRAVDARVTVTALAGDDARSGAVALARRPRANVTLEIIDAPRTRVDMGETAHLLVRIANASDAATRIALQCTPRASDGRSAAKDVDLAALELAAGGVREIALDFMLPLDLADGESLAITIAAIIDDEIVASVAHTVVVSNRIWIDTEEWMCFEGAVPIVTLHNRGVAVARELRLLCDDGIFLALADIAPGETGRHVVDRARARILQGGATLHVGSRTCRLAPFGNATNIARARLSMPSRMSAGIAADAEVTVCAQGSIRTLRLQFAANAVLSVVAGSTRINGHALADAMVPALAGDGLVLHDVPADLPVSFALRLVARDAEVATPLFVIDADGIVQTIAGDPIPIDRSVAFPSRPPSLPFFVDGMTFARDEERARGDDDMHVPDARIDAGVDVVRTLAPELASPSPTLLAFAISPERLASIARLLRGARAPGLAGHVVALRALFPDTAVGNVADTVAEAHEAVRAVIDRLYIALRIPGYELEQHDMEDTAMRRAMLALFDHLAENAPALPLAPLHPSGFATTTLHAEELAVHRAHLMDEPLGSPRALAAVAALLPHACGEWPELEVALSAYVGALRRAFGDLGSRSVLDAPEHAGRGDHAGRTELASLRAALAATCDDLAGAIAP
jgi:hypothetical protein